MATAPNTPVATPWGVNVADNYAWTGTNSWAGASTFNSSATFNSTVVLNSTSANYGGFYNYAQIYNYGTFYQYGTFQTSAVAGSIPFINASQQLAYDADDFFRNNNSKRYGFGIGAGDSLLAKIHVVGLLSCTGTPPDCSTYTASGQGTCESFGCTWNYNGSCSSNGDESSCNMASYCQWGGGTNCNTIGDEGTCNMTSPCSWSPTYSSCSGIGDEGTCNSAGGGGYCSWNSNTCGSYSDESSCNSASPCAWNSGSSCSVFNGDSSNCGMNSGCSYLDGGNTCPSYGDEGTCVADTNCTWNGSSCIGICSGTYGAYCGGDNSYCGGSTYPNGGTCGGGFYGQSCIENPSCGGSPYPCSNYAASEGACIAVSGCFWSAEPALYADGDFKIGFSSSQLGGFWGATPVARSSGWTVTGGYTADKSFNPESTTALETARVLGTLIDQLKTYGILGG